MQYVVSIQTSNTTILQFYTFLDKDAYDGF